MERKNVTVYMSENGKYLLDKISMELTGTKIGRGKSLDTILEFAYAHIVNLKALYGERNEKSQLPTTL